LQKLSDEANLLLSKAFYKVTKKTASKPRSTIAIVIICALACTAGWSRLRLETNPTLLYAPQNSQAVQDLYFQQAYFPAREASTAVYVVGQEKGADILTQDVLLSLFDLHDQITEAGSGDASYSMNCAPSSTSGECAKSGILSYWNWNRTLFEQDPDIYTTLSQGEVPSDASSDIQLTSVAGGLSFAESTGNVTGAEAFRLVWYLTAGIEAGQRKSAEASMLNVLRGFQLQSVVFHPWNVVAEENEQTAAVAGDMPLMMSACGLLTVYVCVMMARRHPVKSHSYLGIIGVLGVCLSIAAAFGLVMAIGIPFSLVVNSVIFVALGLGIDDDFVILEAVEEQVPKTDGIPKAMAKAMSVAGASITLTSVTDFVAFMLGSSTTIPALSAFSIYAGVTVFLDFVVQITLYPAVVALDLKRQEQSRLDTFCCTKMPADSKDFACFKNVQREPSESVLHKFFGEVLPNLILHPFGKILVLLSAVGLLAGGMYGTMHLEVELDPRWMVPETSYIVGAYQAQDEYFSTSYLAVPIYTKTAPQGYAAAQDDLQSLLDDCRSLNFTVGTSINYNWYESYISWLQLASASANMSGLDPVTSKPLTEEAFVAHLKTFLASTSGSYFQDSVVFEGSTIVATQIPQLWSLENTKASTMIDHLLDQRAVLGEYEESLDPFVYSGSFPYYEGLIVLFEETLRNVLLACATVFLVCLLVLANAHAAFMVLLSVAMVDLCLLGSLYWMGDYLNTITAVNLLISIGLSVDYSAHVCHAFLNAQGQSRDARAREALRHTGLAVANGGVSSFVAILVGLAATHYIFRVFTRMTMLIVGLGLYFGMVVLPVLLALLGPKTPNSDLHKYMMKSFRRLGPN
ncbi:unnamed protein product, partial [Heterosigma akashiwo]